MGLPMKIGKPKSNLWRAPWPILLVQIWRLTRDRSRNCLRQCREPAY